MAQGMRSRARLPIRMTGDNVKTALKLVYLSITYHAVSILCAAGIVAATVWFLVIATGG